MCGRWGKTFQKKSDSFSIWVANTDLLAIWLTCGGANIVWEVRGEKQKLPEEEEWVDVWRFSHQCGKLNYCSQFFITFKENYSSSPLLWLHGGWDIPYFSVYNAHP